MILHFLVVTFLDHVEEVDKLLCVVGVLMIRVNLVKFVHEVLADHWQDMRTAHLV